MSDPDLIVIHVEGGVVTSVTSDDWNMKIVVINHDECFNQERWIVSEFEAGVPAESETRNIIERVLSGEQVPYPNEEEK